MFDFLSMALNYEDRLVKNTKINGAEIDTVAFTDIDKEYETGLSHKRYNKGNWIILEEYETKEEAEKGHDKWVEKFSDKNNLPDGLSDVSTNFFSKLVKELKEETNDKEE